jgi:hypothetical protein
MFQEWLGPGIGRIPPAVLWMAAEEGIELGDDDEENAAPFLQ